ncbi:MAG: ThiF family adenylyltransferase [Spirochaetales bacterium]|nr:ThiF family adenylyltransferase [Spirochaetales bacterium]
MYKNNEIWKCADGLKDKKIAIIGIGGLGANSSLLLTQAGIKTLRLVDFDIVEACNLNRGQVFTYNDIGKSKVDVAAGNIGLVNTGVDVEPVNMKINSYEDVVNVIADMDFVIRAADKPIPLFNHWFNQACLDYRKPFITGGMNEYTGIYGPLCVPGKTACLGCSGTIEPHQKTVLLNGDSVLSPSWGPLMGFIGDLMANDIIHYLSGRQPKVLFYQYVLDAIGMTILPKKIPKYTECPFCGDINYEG